MTHADTSLPSRVMRWPPAWLAASTSVTPSQAASRQTRARIAAACSPIPAVNTSASSPPRAAEAVDLYVYRIGRELGSLAAALGGLDAVVFTAGIGEHAAGIRARVCRNAAWLGLELDEAANQAGRPRISREGGKVAAWVIPTDEELMIARHTSRLTAL